MSELRSYDPLGLRTRQCRRCGRRGTSAFVQYDYSDHECSNREACDARIAKAARRRTAEHAELRRQFYREAVGSFPSPPRRGGQEGGEG